MESLFWFKMIPIICGLVFVIFVTIVWMSFREHGSLQSPEQSEDIWDFYLFQFREKKNECSSVNWKEEGF